MNGAIEFRCTIAALDATVLASLYRECTPKVLVVTDNLNFNSSSGFGLTRFVVSLRGGSIHGMTPVVTTASRYGSAGADITNFNFTNATNGLLKSRHDVLFLLGIDSEGVGTLPQPQVDAILRFMQAGGGVFATGGSSSTTAPWPAARRRSTGVPIRTKANAGCRLACRGTSTSTAPATAAA